MAATDNKLKQRIVGALVLIALAVIFLPMLFKNEEPVREVVVDAPEMPASTAAPQFTADPVAIPEPVVDPAAQEWGEIIEPQEQIAVQVIAPAPAPKKVETVNPAPAQPVTQKPAAVSVAPGIDQNNLPVSWSIQLANLTSKDNAHALRDTYRKKQYNAYVRSADGTHRVLIGPLVKQAEAQALCKSLKSREGQECFVVRYQP
ncbi:MAG TPA: SPOR domain-containing protein [Thiopseudomonas sp.]|nr:SPOR domain-containing protein [Thiopseudomonas sp.]